MRAYWEKDIHIVVRRMNPSSPVYEVKRETGDSATRILHRDLLLPCNDLPVDDTPPQHASRPIRKSKRRRTRLSTHENSRPTDENSENSSEEEEIVLVPNQLPSTEAEIDIESNTPIIHAENDVPSNENAEPFENEQPEERIEANPTENHESAPLTPPPPLPNVPEIVVSEEPLISNTTEEPIVYSERPVRLRQVPNRLSYFAPGQAYSVQASPFNTVHNRPFIENQPILVRIPMNNPVMTQFAHPPMPFITPSCRQPIQNFVPQQFVFQRPIYI